MTTRSRLRPLITRLTVLLLAASLFVAVETTVTSVEPAAAASASDWDPGYIIDDAIFYESTSMTAPAVQSFLSGQVSTCRSGYTCLKDYQQVTDNRPADRYCDGYSGGIWETAAQIIDKVARSCGISQRVLLVLLQKEQGLVTATAPSAWNYSAAMGQGCPDTAPCDPNTAGFFYQVYYAARQFEVYRLNPTSFAYREQRTNNILYNPNSACGTKSVFINNQATAALYIYTPYTPNTAALNNLYGTGDDCSSYGNRNFWRLFTDWFGNPRTYAVHPGLAGFYNDRGGAGGPIGAPTSYPVYLEANGQGWYQRFSGGNLYGSNWGGTVFVANNVILAEFNRNGGPGGTMGWPNGEQSCSTGVRCSQSFLYASISTTPRYGAHMVGGGLNTHWRSTGATDGSLGAALNDVTYLVTSAGPGWVQNFEQGVLVQSQYGFHVVPYGSIQQTWSASGAGAGWLGWPRGAVTCAAVGCAQLFAQGIVTSTDTWGAYGISGGFVAEWEARGGLGGLGAALNNLSFTAANGGGWAQNFSTGILAQSGVGSFVVPYGRSQGVWTAAGGQFGSLGWPQSAQTCDNTGCGQQFQTGAITESTWGVYSTFGGLGAVWRAGGGMAAYGPALNNIRYSAANGGGWVQHFGNGVITQNPSGLAVFTQYGPILTTWYQYGAEATWLGWPSGPQTCDANGCIQQYQNGVARSDPQGVVTFLPA
ncbi:hypothetical protein [Microbacterium terregens]|uniref:LGFP repeat-containing protein n=1 Tax=Microbacterium terregens TaxID=69363 RepID=A0ABV5T2B9_9MICO